MAKNFEWHKDEEEGWEEPQPEPERPSRPFRPHPALFVIVIIVGVVVLVGYWRIRQQVNETTSLIESDIVARARLLQESVNQQDWELFDSLLPTELKRARMHGEFTVGRQWQRPFSWKWQPTTFALPEITLSPDLQLATVVMPQTYAIAQSNGITQTFKLLQTDVFQFHSGNWLLDGSTDINFWGDRQTIEGKYITMVFPARDRHDEQAVERLLDELDTMIPTICQRITERDCPTDFNVPISLYPTGLFFDDLYNPPLDRDTREPIHLPTPTLIGLPVDEAGWQILVTTYSIPLARLLIPPLTGWHGEAPEIYELLREQVLLETGLQSSRRWWPQDYDAVLNGMATLAELSALYDATSESRRIDSSQIVALIEFLLARGDTAVSLQNRLATANNFWQWANLDPTDPAIEREWQQFLYNHSSYAFLSPPIPLPSSDIRLLCGDDLLRYDLAAHTWRSELPADRTLIDILPENNGLLVYGRFFHEDTREYRGRAFLWQNGRERYITEWRTNTDFPLQSLQRYDPSGHKVGLMVRELFGPPVLYLLDIDSCAEESCPWPRLSGLPIWSPDGRYTLIAPSEASEPGQLWLGDGDTHLLVELGTGYAPFWLDNETYGYVRLGNTGYSQVVLANVADNVPRIVTTVDGLLGQLPGPDNLLSPLITAVVPNLITPDQLLITVMEGVDPIIMHLYEIQLEGNEAVAQTKLLSALEDVTVSFAPNGRYLVTDKISAGDATRRTISITTGDDGADEGFAFSAANNSITYDWTTDSQWLLLNTPNHLKLIAPDHDYQQFIFHDFVGCYEAQWVD